MNKKRISLLVFLAIILFTVVLMPTNVMAAQQLNLKIGSWFYEKDTYTMGYDVNLYYSFFNKDNVVLNIDGDKASMTLEADKFTHNTKNFETPRIDFIGTYKKDGNKNIINLSGKVNGTIINEFMDHINYTKTKLDRLDIEIIYYDSKVKDGKVTATASGRADGLTLSKSGDSPEIENPVENSPIYTIKEFEISGIGNGGNTAATVKQNDSKEENKEGIKKEENNSTIPIVVVTATVVIIGGIAIKRFYKVKNAKTGEVKIYEFNPESGEYENEDTILNTSNIEEVNKQAEKDKKWIEEEREKIKNRDTLQDKENQKMQDEIYKNTKEMEREIYIDKIASRNGINSTNEETIRKELENKQKIAEKNAEDRKKIADHIDTVVKTAEVVEEGADIAISVGEAVVPGGKAVSAGYKVLKSTASSIAENGLDAAKTTSAIIKGGLDAATTFADSGIIKATSAIGGEVAGDTVEATIQGKDVTEVIEAGTKAAIKGTAKAVVGATGDAIGKGTKEAVGNVISNEYQKHVVDPKMDKKFKKTKK